MFEENKHARESSQNRPRTRKRKNEDFASNFTLEKKAKLLRRLNELKGKPPSPPTINFTELEGLPVFLECISEARFVKTRHGDREAVDIRILRDVGSHKEGDDYTWWLTQTVVRSKIEFFKPLEGRRLCVICLGEREGQRYDYFDYYIDTEEEGWKLLEETFGEEQ